MKRALLLATLLTPLPILAQGFEGAYAGIYTGYAWAEDEGTSYSAVTGTKTGWTQETSPRSVQYGALAGYNWLLGEQWLLGVEADYEGRADSGDSNYQELDGIQVDPYSGSSSIESSGSLRARAGYLPTPDLLLFATAGYAYAEVEREWRDDFMGTRESQRNGQNGWTVGLGAEYLLNQAISARVEYRYADFGTEKNIAVDMWREEFNQRLTEQSLRLGASYHF